MKSCFTIISSEAVMASLIVVFCLFSTIGAAEDLIPDLIVEPIHLYDTEIDTTIIPGRIHLKLSFGAANIGDGPLYLRGIPNANPSEPIQVMQRIYRSDSTYWERLAGQFQFHESHDHIHLDSWGQFKLREILAYDSVGAVVVQGAKVSFCIIDYELYDPTLPNYTGDFFLGCMDTLQGLSVGWIDIYEKGLPGQWIDITDIPKGTYWLEGVVDPDDSLLEKDETNNSARVKVDLCLPELVDPVIIGDTLYIDSVTGVVGSQFRVDVHATNSKPIWRMVIPFTWAGDFILGFDSVSTVGLRTEYFEQQRFNAQDYGNNRVSYLMSTSLSGTAPDLPPGSGAVLSIYFTLLYGEGGTSNPIAVTSFNNKKPVFVTGCLAYEPYTVAGSVSLCCLGDRGNVNGDPLDEVDISDLTAIVDFLFLSGPAPVCDAEADIDGSNSVDVSDLTYMVSYLFQNGPAPVSCD